VLERWAETIRRHAAARLLLSWEEMLQLERDLHRVVASVRPPASALPEWEVLEALLPAESNGAPTAPGWHCVRSLTGSIKVVRVGTEGWPEILGLTGWCIRPDRIERHAVLPEEIARRFDALANPPPSVPLIST